MDDDNTTNQFYSDDLNAQVVAENNLDPDLLKQDGELPITSGNISLGDLDQEEAVEDIDGSYDEENVAGGEDNVTFEDDTEDLDDGDLE